MKFIGGKEFVHISLTKNMKKKSSKNEEKKKRIGRRKSCGNKSINE